MKVKKGGTEAASEAAAPAEAAPEQAASEEALVDANEKLKIFFDVITNEEEFSPKKLEIDVKKEYSTLNESIINKKKQQAIYNYLHTNENNILVQYKNLLLNILKEKASSS